MSETVGWEAPLLGGLAGAMLLAGVPAMFCIINSLVMILALVVQWRVVLLGAALHLVVALLTAWEPGWWSMLRQYRRYGAYYEG